jgi:hypothetical protein
MDTKVTDWLDLLIKSFVGWINKGIEFFGLYTTKYSKMILILIGLWIATKIFNIKLNLGGGRKS